MPESKRRSSWLVWVAGLVLLLALPALILGLPVRTCPSCGGDAFLIDGVPPKRYDCGGCDGTGTLTIYTRWRLIRETSRPPE
jgi:hypothetical protein